MEKGKHCRTEHDEEQVVLGKLPAGDAYRTGQARRARPQHVLRPPRPERKVLDDQNERKGSEQLEKFWCPIDPPQQGKLDEKTKDAYCECRERHAEPEADALRQPDGEIHAEHVQRAVGEVDDAADAEDERQPGGDQEERARTGEPVQELQEDG